MVTLDVLATAALSLLSIAWGSYLLAVSVLFGGFRRWVANRYGEEHKLADLVTCPFCVAPYIAAPIITSAILWGGETWWQILAAWASASFAAPALVVLTDRS